MEIGHDRFENSGRVLTGLPRSLQSWTVGVTRETGVVPWRIRAANGTSPLLVASHDTRGNGGHQMQFHKVNEMKNEVKTM